MKYLAIRNTSHVRKDGTTAARASWVHKTKKYGDVISETTISPKRNTLIVGGNDSGKSRNLDRLYSASTGLYGGRRGAAIKIGGLTPLAQWSETATVRDWYENNRISSEKHGQKFEALADFYPRPFSNLKQYERLDLLEIYLRESKAVLFVDDAHKLSGRKLDIARNCVVAADKWVIATSEETRLATSLRNIVMKQQPQDIRLTTDASYDASAVLIYLMIAVAVAGGWYEAALIMGGLKAMSSGRRASRAD